MTNLRASGQTTGYRTEGCVVDEGGSAAVDGQSPVRAEACLLGPVRLVADGVDVPLPGPARDLLGLLALRPGETVPVDQVGAALWTVPRQRGAGAGERVDAAAEALAAALTGAGCPEVLRRTPDGLVLRLPGRAVDAIRFGHLLGRARELMTDGDWAGASARFASALRLWQVDIDGDPLAGTVVNPLGWLQADRTRLVQMRAAAIEDRWECLLRRVAAALTAAGAPAADADAVAAGSAAVAAAEEAVADLERALARHPLRERLWELLLTATAFARGRRAAAEVHDRAVLAVADNLGVEPGRRLGEIAALVRSGGLATWWEQPEPCPPAPAAAVPARAALPVPLTPLIGRERLAARVAGHLADGRLVTLTGPGGSGKTRLAVAVAADRAPVWFVDLSVVDDPARVVVAVAATLGVRDEPGRAIADTLADALGSGGGLLLLDNCEHVVGGAAELARVLLDRCPALRILATSRVALRLPDELTVPVPPLPGPAPDGEHTIAGLAIHPASRLFLERARARSGRPVPEADAAAVALLCAELDGLPLAIELAAARTPVLSVPEIVERLRADHSVLRSPDPTAPARHRTVAAAVESSVDQLAPAARLLFDRLAVFAGGFDAEAAEAVAGPDAAEGLAALVEASLVETQRPGADARYRMLMPIHRQALARLRGAGAEDAARGAHARHFLALAEHAEGGLRGSAQGWWLGRLRREAPNLRAAMGWLGTAAESPAEPHGDAGVAADPHGDLRLAGALAGYCRLEGYYRDGREWLVDALARHPDAPAALRAKALAGAGMLAMLLCDYPAAAGHAAAARAACRAAGDPLGEARVELTLGSVARERAEYKVSAAHLDAAARLFGVHGDDWGVAQSALLRGFTAWLATDLDRAEAKLRASLAGFERLGDPEAAATALMNLGAVALYRGDGDRAASLLDTALDRFTALAFPEGLGWAHNLRGLAELRAGRTGRAVNHLTRSLATHRQVGDRWRTASVLEALAEAARIVGAGERGAALLGAAATIRTELGTPVPACELYDLAATAAGLRTQLGEEAYAAAHRAGQTASLDTLVSAAEPAVPALPARAEPA
ncbi:AfsR/SARP family transcriptional regulator [Asanoa iriomotensis]|nr:BTAD domain-containing putative transcriptional regulator [Asanoa iriomotensis]